MTDEYTIDIKKKTKKFKQIMCSKCHIECNFLPKDCYVQYLKKICNIKVHLGKIVTDNLMTLACERNPYKKGKIVSFSEFIKSPENLQCKKCKKFITKWV